MRVQLQFAAKLLQAALQRVSHFAGPTNGNRVAGRFFKESLEYVQHVSGHGSFGWETAENAHGIDKVVEEGDRDDFVDRLVQRIKSEWEVQKDIGMRGHKRETSSSCRQKAGVLSQI